MFLRLGEVFHQQVCLADILVRAAVPRVQIERAPIVLEREVELLEIAVGIAQVILQIGVARIPQRRLAGIQPMGPERRSRLRFRSPGESLQNPSRTSRWER